MNYRAIWAIYYTEMARTGRTLMQSVASPVLSTSLYFIVFTVDLQVWVIWRASTR